MTMSAAPPEGPVLVTGATGPHGGAVAEALLAAGRRVRALTRDPSSVRARELGELGAEPVAGDLLDRESLLGAMRGASVTYAVTTPFADGEKGEIQQGEQILAAAREVEAPWLILASVASADRATGVPHFESKWMIEQRLSASPPLDGLAMLERWRPARIPTRSKSSTRPRRSRAARSA
jgi:uncharacterized protein YbjT (DUF2867 family)